MYILNKKIVKIILNKIKRILQIFGYTRKYYRNEKVLGEFYSKYSRDMAVSCDVGSGPRPKNPFKAAELYGVDFRENLEINVLYADLSLGQLPFANESFDFVTAFDLLEHIVRVKEINGETKFPFILLMNEIYRVLKPNGIFFAYQPVYPAKSVFQDPTHVNLMSEDTLDYYFCEKAWARIYGYSGSFALLSDGWVGDKYFCFMRKVGIEPILDLNFKQE